MVSTQKWCSCSDAPEDICPSVSQTWFQLSLITATAVSDQSLLHTMGSFCCRTAQIWKLYKNRKAAATPTVLFAVTMGEFPSLFFFSTVWGSSGASLLQPVSKEKDGESKRWKQISWGRLLSWISPSLMLFWKPQLLLSVDYKDQIPFLLKKKKVIITDNYREKSWKTWLKCSCRAPRRRQRVEKLFLWQPYCKQNSGFWKDFGL